MLSNKRRGHNFNPFLLTYLYPRPLAATTTCYFFFLLLERALWISSVTLSIPCIAKWLLLNCKCKGSVSLRHYKINGIQHAQCRSLRLPFMSFQYLSCLCSFFLAFYKSLSQPDSHFINYFAGRKSKFSGNKWKYNFVLLEFWHYFFQKCLSRKTEGCDLHWTQKSQTTGRSLAVITVDWSR